MSPTSYPCSTPRYSVHSPECLYIITRSLMFVKRFTKKILQKVKISSETAPDIMSVRNNICRCAVNIRAFFLFLPEISFLTVLLYTLSVIIKSKDKTRCKSVRLIQKGGKYDIYSFIYRSDHLWHLEKLRTADSGILSQ